MLKEGKEKEKRISIVEGANPENNNKFSL